MNKKLSIVFITNNYTPYQGGVVSSILATREALRALGHTVTLITLDFENNHIPEHDTFRLYCPIRFMYKKNHMALPWCPRYYIDKLVKQLKPDIIHVHHPFLLGVSALKAAHQSNIPVVFTYHTLYEQYLHYIPLPKQITCPLVKTMVQSFCNTVNGIIAPSSAVKEYISSIAPRTPTEIIPSSIPARFFAYDSSLKNTMRPFKLLTVSRFTQEKNITFLLDLMSLLNPAHYTLTLAGYGNDYKTLQDYAYSYKKFSSHYVLFKEKPSKQELLELYQQSHLFIFASTTETQGIVLAESMAQGTPVITLDGPGQRDILMDGFNGFLVNNHEGMKQRIEECFTNQKLYHALQTNAQKTAQSYSTEHLINKLINFYHSIIKSPSKYSYND